VISEASAKVFIIIGFLFVNEFGMPPKIALNSKPTILVMGFKTLRTENIRSIVPVTVLKKWKFGSKNDIINPDKTNTIKSPSMDQKNNSK
jgi:hypothetical protein